MSATMDPKTKTLTALLSKCERIIRDKYQGDGRKKIEEIKKQLTNELLLKKHKSEYEKLNKSIAALSATLNSDNSNTHIKSLKMQLKTEQNKEESAKDNDKIAKLEKDIAALKEKREELNSVKEKLSELTKEVMGPYNEEYNEYVKNLRKNNTFSVDALIAKGYAKKAEIYNLSKEFSRIPNKSGLSVALIVYHTLVQLITAANEVKQDKKKLTLDHLVNCNKSEVVYWPLFQNFNLVEQARKCCTPSTVEGEETPKWEGNENQLFQSCIKDIYQYINKEGSMAKSAKEFLSDLMIEFVNRVSDQFELLKNFKNVKTFSVAMNNTAIYILLSYHHIDRTLLDRDLNTYSKTISSKKKDEELEEDEEEEVKKPTSKAASNKKTAKPATEEVKSSKPVANGVKKPAVKTGKK